MKRQIVVRDPKTGELKVAYKDEGPGGAVVGHGRPMLHALSLGGGAMQYRLQIRATFK